jgi:hypothetical protein
MRGYRTERHLNSEGGHHPSELAQPQLAIDMPGLRNSCGDDLAFHSSESPFACLAIRVKKRNKIHPAGASTRISMRRRATVSNP